MQFLELWNRQRAFSGFRSILSDYWRGVATPFMDRTNARLCLSILRLDYCRLISGVLRRFYGRHAVVSGIYAKDPFTLTGKHLVLCCIAESFRHAFYKRTLKGFGNVPLRMDIASVQASGIDSF